MSGLEQAGLPVGRSSDVSTGHVAVVIGSLQDSYQQFKYQLSAKLARRENPSAASLK